MENVSTIPTEFKEIDIAQLLRTQKPKIARWIPQFIIRSLEKLLHIKEINRVVKEHYREEPLEFIRSINTYLQISVHCIGEEKLGSYLKENPIIVANHPLGGPESLLLMEKIATIRPDSKMVSRGMFSQLQPLSPLLMPIPDKKSRRSAQVFAQAFATESPIMIFPAGYCSRILSNGTLFDYRWYKTFVKMARLYNRPIVPIYLSGKNSQKFYRLSTIRRALNISASLESLLLPDEMFKQKGGTISMHVGEIIHSNILENSISDQEWAQRIRYYVYQLGLHAQASFNPDAIPDLPLS